MLVGKPGLDGHSNGAEQIALRARDIGMTVTYEGIRFTPAELVAQAHSQKVHAIGLSVLSGSHTSLVLEFLDHMAKDGRPPIPVLLGGIIPDEDFVLLKQKGVVKIFTAKDFRLDSIMEEILDIIDSE